MNGCTAARRGGVDSKDKRQKTKCSILVIIHAARLGLVQGARVMWGLDSGVVFWETYFW